MFNLFAGKKNIEATISYILGLSGILANTLGFIITLVEKDKIPMIGILATLGCLIFLILYSIISWSNAKFLNSYNFIITFLSVNVAFPIIFYTTNGVEGAFIFYFFIAASAYGAIIKKKWQIIIFPVFTLVEYYFVIKFSYEAMMSKMWLSFRSLILAFGTSYIFLFVFTYFFSNATRRYYFETEKLAFRDGLTNIYNRRKLNMDLKNQKYHFGAMMDIDNFHAVNNQYGHQYGDVILQILAKICLTTSSDEFRIYRYGGEEFFILSRLTKKDTTRKLKEIQSAFTQETNCTISIGISEKVDYEPYQDFIKKADENMYFVKENGKNSISLDGINLIKS